MPLKNRKTLLLAFILALFADNPSIASAAKVCANSGEMVFVGGGPCPAAALKGMKIFARPNLHKLCKVSRKVDLKETWTPIKAEIIMLEGNKTCLSAWRVCTKCPKKK